MALVLFNRLLSLFVIILLGFLIVRTGMVKPAETRSVSMLCLYVVCPFATVNAFRIERTPEILRGMLLALVFAIIAHIVFIASMRLLKKPLKLTEIERGSVIYSNSGILAIPIVSYMLGAEWVIYTVTFNVVQICLHWTHLRAMMSGEKRADPKKIFLNPNMVAIYVGIILFFTGLQLPGFVSNAVDMVSGSIGPMGMFNIGMMMGGMSFKRLAGYRRVWLVSFLRLILMPVIMVLIAKYLMSGYLPDGETILMISLLSASGPCGATVMQMAQIFKDQTSAEYASAINVISMLCCAVTMPLIVAMYYM